MPDVRPAGMTAGETLREWAARQPVRAGARAPVADLVAAELRRRFDARVCAWCAGSLRGYRDDAVTCGSGCRMRLDRSSLRPPRETPRLAGAARRSAKAAEGRRRAANARRARTLSHVAIELSDDVAGWLLALLVIERDVAPRGNEDVPELGAAITALDAGLKRLYQRRERAARKEGTE